MNSESAPCATRLHLSLLGSKVHRVAQTAPDWGIEYSRVTQPNSLDAFDFRDPEAFLTLLPPTVVEGKGYHIQLVFRLMPEPGDFRRYNLIEGILPVRGGRIHFSVGIRPHRALTTSILTATDSWVSVMTSRDAVRPGACHEATASYDGERWLSIALDGGTPVRRDVGPAKAETISNEARPPIFVGRWSSSTGHYQFLGFIGDIRIATFINGDVCVR